MSLINKMLQDLEQRNDAASKSEPLSGEVRAVAVASSPRSGKLPGLLVLGVAVLVGAWFFVQPRTSQAPVIVAVAPPAPAVVAAPAPVAVPAPAPAVAKPAAAVAVVPVAVAPITKPAAKPVAEPSAKPAAVQVAVAAQVVTKKASKVITEEAAPTPTPTPALEKTVPVAAAPAIESKPQKQFNPQQQSDNLYKQAIAQVQQGQNTAARQSLRQALQANQNNVGARQMLAGLLAENNAPDEASALLREGLKLSPAESGFSMALARLQLENGDTNGGMTTLEQGLPSAGNDPQYHAFYAVLLQRAKRHEDAVKHYLVALRSDPSMPTWLVGIGISLQAQGKDNDATEAFQRAKDSGLLTPQLTRFVEQRLNQLAK